MNLSSIANPHLIYPGQVLYLVRSNGYARLSTTAPNGDPEVVRVSPQTRESSLNDLALPTLPPHLIEPFLAEPLVVDSQALAQAPRIIATQDKRVLMANGDRAYVRNSGGALITTGKGQPASYRIFRDATPSRTPSPGKSWATKPSTWAVPPSRVARPCWHPSQASPHRRRPARWTSSAPRTKSAPATVCCPRPSSNT